MEDRLSQLPVKKDRKKVNNSAIPRYLKPSSGGGGKIKNTENKFQPLQNPLTPLHRLKKFKSIRDRNLRKAAVKTNKLIKMTIDMEKNEDENHENVKEMDNKPIENGNDKEENLENLTKENGKQEDSNEKVTTNGVHESNGNDLEHNEIDKPKIEIVEEKEENNETNNDNIPSINEADVAENNENINDEKIESTTTTVQNKIQVKEVKFQTEEETINPQPSTSKRIFFEMPSWTNSKLSEPKFKSETYERLRTTTKIQPRRSLWQNNNSAGLYRKRKFDNDMNDDYDDLRNNEKKKALNEIKGSSPSVISPGWKFFSSPFPKFWSPINRTPPPGSTPYKSPYPIPNDLEEEEENITNNANIIEYKSEEENDIYEDSMAVNFDDKSLCNKLNDNEFEQAIDFEMENCNKTIPKNNYGWCSMM